MMRQDETKTVKYRFISTETGAPYPKEYNELVNRIFENHPVLDELLHIDKELMYITTADILSGRFKDWDSREELISCMLEWNLPDLKCRIDRAVMLLRQNSKQA
jgi:hypothetical protein